MTEMIPLTVGWCYSTKCGAGGVVFIGELPTNCTVCGSPLWRLPILQRWSPEPAWPDQPQGGVVMNAPTSYHIKRWPVAEESVVTGPVQGDVEDAPGGGPDPVDVVIEQLGKRIVPPPARTRLRDALDRADKPLGGREAADEAMGRAIRLGRP